MASQTDKQNFSRRQCGFALVCVWLREAGKTLFFQPASPSAARRAWGVVLCSAYESEDDEVNSDCGNTPALHHENLKQ